MIENAIFLDLTFIILLSTVGALLARFFKQPLIPVYMLVGLIIGPILGLIQDVAMMKLFAEIGIAFLLFVVGLELDLKRIKSIGFVASVGGALQVWLLFLLAFLLVFALGFTKIQSVYMGLALAFSSTLVVIKLLSDAKEIDTLHGRIIIGILLMQDIIAVFALSVLNFSGAFSAQFLLAALGKGLLLFGLAFVLSKFAFPDLFRFAARSGELLLLISLAVLFAFSALSVYLGFSIIIGGFLAGLTLANLEYNFEIIGKVKPLRDFFAILFFVSLGMQVIITGVETLIVPAIILFLFIILVKPLVIMILTNFFGYANRTSFLTAVSLAQVSEFGLIIIAQGLVLGHIGEELLSLVIVLAIASITVSTYFIKYDQKLYNFLSRYLRPLEKIGQLRRELKLPKPNKYSTLVVGCDRIGYSIVKTLRRMKKKYLVIDYNPELIRKLHRDRIPCMYGDISDIEILERLNIRDLKMIISTIPALDVNTILLKVIRRKNKNALVFLTSNDVDDALRLYELGADYVILPHFLGGDHVSVLMEESVKDIKTLLKTRSGHIKELRHRNLIGHRYPRRH